MAKTTSIGEMRSRIRIVNVENGVDGDGFRTITETDAIGAPVWCAWKWAHGSEVMENQKLGIKQSATITMRYSPHITETSRIYLLDEGDDEKPFEVVSIDHVDQRRTWLEVKVKRGAKA